MPTHDGGVVAIFISGSTDDLEHATETSLEFLPITDGIVAQHEVHG